ncbi:hypothetical protein ANN_21583 [Periplaneta americana]|uniref:Uncharacterized protein n=1 Tax=Periplaneta americana TaxID=6978 RepID=A0ABQ8S5U5_PERAM|nr:hypothetical protein ANN_21583 [Periplaneta americana]
MSPGSNTVSYPAFARIGLRENPGKNLNQVTCPDRESNPGHLVSRLDVLTLLTKTCPAVGGQAESLLAGAAEGARDVEAQRLATPVVVRTLVDVCQRNRSMDKYGIFENLQARAEHKHGQSADITLSDIREMSDLVANRLGNRSDKTDGLPARYQLAVSARVTHTSEQLFFTRSYLSENRVRILTQPNGARGV